MTSRRLRFGQEPDHLLEGAGRERAGGAGHAEEQAESGGLPVPAFDRGLEQRACGVHRVRYLLRMRAETPDAPATGRSRTAAQGNDVSSA